MVVRIIVTARKHTEKTEHLLNQHVNIKYYLSKDYLKKQFQDFRIMYLQNHDISYGEFDSFT